MAKENPKKKYAIAVDLGATNLRVAVGDETGRFIVKVKEKTARKGNENTIAEQIIKIINSLKVPGTVLGIGIGAIGPLDFRKGVKIHSHNNPIGLINLTPIAKRLKKPVYVLNDCNAGVLGEKIFGAGRPFESLIYVTISTGLGGGVIDNGCLILGEDGNAIEPGHLVVDPEGKMKCGCGKRGHWEAYCSAGNMPKYFNFWLKQEKKKIWKGSIKAEEIFKKAGEKDKTALEFIKELTRINALALADLINIFNPGLITFGGPVVLKNKKLILNPLKKEIKKYNYNPIPEIKITPLVEDIVLYGALAAVFSEVGFKLN